MQSRSNTNLQGIDVSHHNIVTDWSKVRAAGNQFVFIKTTEGVSYTDPAFDSHYRGAKSQAMKVGFYHYARAEKNSAVDEANWFVAKTKGYELDLAYVLDLEGDCQKLGATKVTQWAKTFLDTVKAATGKPVAIYTGGSFARTYCGSVLAEYPLWVAHYGVNTPMSNPTWNKWSVFQYTSSGSVAGIKGNVDMNVMEQEYFDKLTVKVAKPTTPTPQPTELDKVKVVVNDVLVAFGRNIQGHIYLPLRAIGEALDKQVGWDNKRKVPSIEGKELKQFMLIENVTYAQIREAAELLNGKVSFDNGTKKVYIYK